MGFTSRGYAFVVWHSQDVALELLAMVVRALLLDAGCWYGTFASEYSFWCNDKRISRENSPFCQFPSVHRDVQHPDVCQDQRRIIQSRQIYLFRRGSYCTCNVNKTLRSADHRC